MCITLHILAVSVLLWKVTSILEDLFLAVTREYEHPAPNLSRVNMGIQPQISPAMTCTDDSCLEFPSPDAADVQEKQEKVSVALACQGRD